MATKLLLVVSVAILVLGIIGETTAQYRQGGYGYGGYGHHSHPYYQQQRPPYGEYQQQPGYQQQLPGVSVQEAEWVCKNPKTGDMMIIALDDGPGSRNNGPPQWHQVHPQNNQPNNVQPQPTFGDPTYQHNPFLKTEKAEIPIRPNNYQPTKPPTKPTGTFTTTERGPIWPSDEDTTTKKTVSTVPLPGFTVEDAPTTRRPFINDHLLDLTTQKPTTTSAFDPDDDDEPIEIVLGK